MPSVGTTRTTAHVGEPSVPRLASNGPNESVLQPGRDRCPVFADCEFAVYELGRPEFVERVAERVGLSGQPNEIDGGALGRAEVLSRRAGGRW